LLGDKETENMRKIEIVDYDHSWPQLFEAERDLLQQTLGDVCIKIFHIGSTAVLELAAKPIIDILIEVTDVEALDELNVEMEIIGYNPKGEFGIPGRRYFQKGDDNRSHHIHAFARGDSNVMRHIAFRDYLRTHPEVAREYGELKRNVADACENDVGKYCDGKDRFVKRIEAIAMKEISPNKAMHTDEDSTAIRLRR